MSQCLQWTVLLPARGRAVSGAMADEQALSTVCSSIMASGGGTMGLPEPHITHEVIAGNWICGQ